MHIQSVLPLCFWGKELMALIRRAVTPHEKLWWDGCSLVISLTWSRADEQVLTGDFDFRKTCSIIIFKKNLQLVIYIAIYFSVITKIGQELLKTWIALKTELTLFGARETESVSAGYLPAGLEGTFCLDTLWPQLSVFLLCLSTCPASTPSFWPLNPPFSPCGFWLSLAEFVHCLSEEAWPWSKSWCEQAAGLVVVVVGGNAVVVSTLLSLLSKSSGVKKMVSSSSSSWALAAAGSSSSQSARAAPASAFSSTSLKVSSSLSKPAPASFGEEVSFFPSLSLKSDVSKCQLAFGGDFPLNIGFFRLVLTGLGVKMGNRGCTNLPLGCNGGLAGRELWNILEHSALRKENKNMSSEMFAKSRKSCRNY